MERGLVALGALKMKLHAVAPGGPPEGQCEKSRKMVCNTTFDDPFRKLVIATDLSCAWTPQRRICRS